MDTLQMSQYTKNWSRTVSSTFANWEIKIMASCKKQMSVIDGIVDNIVHCDKLGGHGWPLVLKLEADKYPAGVQIINLKKWWCKVFMFCKIDV